MGAAAAGIATSAAFGPVLRVCLTDTAVVHPEGNDWRLAYCVWVVTTHALGAFLHRRFAKRGTPSRSLDARG